MALTVGELTGFIDLDDSGARRGLARTRAGMDDLVRGTDGRLRDLRGRFVAESAAMGGALGDRVRSGAVRAAKGLALVGGAVPIVAAGTAALMGLAAGAVAAGLAVKAFSAAVGPQMEAVQEVADLAAEAEKAAAEGAADAAEKQQEYNDALAQLPPATRDAATAFIGLKSDYQAWSDSLSTTTMPVVTKGLTALRSLLPSLTPFVEAAAGAFSGFFDDISTGIKSAEFKEWVSETSAVAGPALRDILTVVKNFAVGFAGLLQAFLPASAGVTGGLVTMSAAFADWGTSLDDSEGFATFLDLAEQGAGTLGDLGGAAVEVLVALSPLLGVTAQLALILAQILTAVPTPVLTALAVVIGSVTVATKAWALAQTVVAARNAIWTSSQWALNASMFASPVFWIIAAIVALVAVVVLIATKTDWLQRGWSAAWGFIQSTTDTAVSGIGAALGWFGSLPSRLGGWFGSAKDAAVGKIVELTIWLAGVPGRTASALAGLPVSLRRSAVNGFQAFRTAAGQKAAEFLVWVRGMPRRIASGIGSLGGLLTGKGRDVVRGLWRGIKSMGGWLRDTLIGWAKSIIPGPVAKALGIASPSKVMADQVGRWIPAGIVQGIESGQGAVDRTMRNLVTTPTPGQATAAAMAAQTGTAAGDAVGGGRLVLDVTGADAEWKRLVRRMVRVDGRGSVQTAFGT
ncbi:hypothetical protein C9F11_20195 [Streptomyces sp. YIM 121038]|uniref:phage tail protein n=1 Tax=Streptomyces sp. YIM 121038 TaxID=2136401 RepID=UPI00111088EC|nr:hypothetical protein [Streptomyces sp. YIM 121038]QCX77674.1 hypothetical protein C9F11_20195 [Streptomyces sp. YIM 121038]